LSDAAWPTSLDLLEKVPACGRYFSDAVERLLEERTDVHSL
jgi:hypothetical protein